MKDIQKKTVIKILACRDEEPILKESSENFLTEVEYFPSDCPDIVERIACAQPDAVFLRLFMPHADAIEIIRAYKSLYGDTFTYFAVLCPILTAGLKRELNSCGVDRILCYPCQNREFGDVLAELSRMKLTAIGINRSSDTHAIHRLHHAHISDRPYRIEKAAEETLGALGVGQENKGCQYLLRAVIIAAGRRNGSVSLTNVIYPTVAAEFHTSPSCVERNIRLAINEAWHSESRAILSAYFGNTLDNLRGQPSNSEFIALLADRIRLDALFQASQRKSDSIIL